MSCLFTHISQLELSLQCLEIRHTMTVKNLITLRSVVCFNTRGHESIDLIPTQNISLPEKKIVNLKLLMLNQSYCNIFYFDLLLMILQFFFV